VAQENAISFHSQQANSWESGYSSRTFSVRLDILKGLLNNRDLAGQTWLDAGCGTGTLARWLAAHKGCQVLGVDASEPMIANCERGPGTEFRVIRDISNLEIADSTFDGILCSSVLEYTGSPEQALRELRRVLKSGGILLVSVPNASPLARLPQVALYWLTKFTHRRKLTYLDHSKWSYSRRSFARMLRRCAFSPCDHRKFGEVRLSNIKITADGTMLMVLAEAI
jgi:ubiquinone/menaquinone biosynthesis C-methylase UbiE